MIRVIDEEIVDQDRHLHQYPHHRHLQQHHHLDQMILFDEEVQQIHVIVIQDENMIVNDDDDIIMNIIIVDDQDPGQEDGELKFNFSRNHSRSFSFYSNSLNIDFSIL
jgi:hypothetical protein